jgi:hypothetical protein
MVRIIIIHETGIQHRRKSCDDSDHHHQNFSIEKRVPQDHKILTDIMKIYFKISDVYPASATDKGFRACATVRSPTIYRDQKYFTQNFTALLFIFYVDQNVWLPKVPFQNNSFPSGRHKSFFEFQRHRLWIY